MSGSHLSKEFFDLVKSIGESRSKQEEDKIIVQEVQTLKQKMGAKDVPARKMREYLIRMLYVEMLGHDASFGHIHAVKMTHSRSLLEKRVGYLAVSLTLHPDHSFMLLLINTLQQDLRSDNWLEASMALTVVAKLLNAETIPAILPLVVKLLDHKEGTVKKKAVMVLHRCHQIDPSSISVLGGPIRKALCDSNISVMAASLNLFLDLALAKPQAYKDLVPDFVSILKQVIEHRLPRDYDYHRMPAPWVQMRLLQILAVLGASDKNASEGMYEILREVMKRADIGINVGYAIVYECVRTVTSIYPDASLIEDAANSISRFLTSDNHNLKYLGVNALSSIVQIDSKYAAQHQLVVIDALEDPDETLKRKTLDLLYSMTNPHNVTVIVSKLIQFLQTATDNFLRADLISRINQLAEKYAPSNEWFIDTMNEIFELSGQSVARGAGADASMNAGIASGRSATGATTSSGTEKVIKNEMSQSILRLLSEHANELSQSYPDGNVPDDQSDIRAYAADAYIALLRSKKNKITYSADLPDVLIQVIAWVLGEYGHLAKSASVVEVLHLLIALMDRNVDSPAATKSWILMALLKTTSKLVQTSGAESVPSQLHELLAKYSNSLFVDLQQRALEIQELLTNPTTMSAVVPVNNYFDLDIEIDEELSFLDGYVATALANGAKPYNADPAAKAKMLEDAAAASNAAHAKDMSKQGLKYQAYAPPEREIASLPTQSTSTSTSNGHGLFDQYGPGAVSAQPPQPSPTEGQLRLGANVARRWGPQGYNDPDATPATPAQPPAAASTPHAQTPAAVSPSPSQRREQEEQRERDAAAQRERERRAREAATAKPRELTEKEKLASSLFAGVGTTPATTTTPSRHRPHVQQRPPAQQQQQQPQQSASADFLGSLISEAVPVARPVAAGPSAPTPSNAGSGDLLDLFGNTAPTTTAATSPATAAAPSTSGADLFDMLGGGSTSVSAPAAASPTLSADDPFGFGVSSSSASSTSSGTSPDMFAQLGEGSTKYGHAGASASIRTQLASWTASPAGETTLLSESNMQLTSAKYYTPEAIVVALFLSNKTSSPTQDVSLAFNTNQGCNVKTSTDGQGQVSTSANTHRVSFAQVGARTTVTILVELSVRDPSFASAAAGPLQLSNGQVSFGSTPHSFSVELAIFDFLRPAQMKTEQYGQAWKTLAEEVKAAARPSTISSSSEFMSRMSGIQYFPVQTIGAENICAARIVGLAPAPAAAGALPPTSSLVLVHGKVHSHVDLIVRSKARDVSNTVAKALAVALK